VEWKRVWLVKLLGCLIAIGLVFWLPAAAAAESVTLAWDRNTEEDLAGYKVHVGTSPKTYTQIVDVGHATTFTLSDLFPGETYFIAVTAYDIFANESGPSAELIATIPEPLAAIPEPEPTPEVVAKAAPAPEPPPRTRGVARARRTDASPRHAG